MTRPGYQGSGGPAPSNPPSGGSSGTRPTGGPAFPRQLPNVEVPPDEALRIIEQHQGMTLRDWFAGQALAGLLSNPGGPIQANGFSGWGYVNTGPIEVARRVYEQVDAMLAERSK